MKAFDELIEIANTLMGPNGCPWDKEQTMKSLTHYFFEELHELLEAIEEEDTDTIIEEAGDLFYAIVFLAKIGEKQGDFLLEDVIESISKKLVYRHPHVFSEEKLADAQAVLSRWEELKKQEKSHRKSVYDGIPKNLPIISRVQKLLNKAKRIKSPYFQTMAFEKSASEKIIIDQIFALLLEAVNGGINVEIGLINRANELEKRLRNEEPEINS